MSSSGGVLCKFNAKPSGGASGANVRYITRESATKGDERGVYLHNADELRGADYRETRANVTAYASARQDAELTQRRRGGGGEARTHYRCVVSWERKEETDKAREQVREYLNESFANARAVATIHQDTEHTHAHIWIDARQIDGKKVHLDAQAYRRLDEAWARTYARHYGREYERDHLAKKRETRSYKAARAKGEQRAKPTRAERVINTKEYKAREKRNYGADKERAGRDQSNASERQYAAARGERATNDATGEREYVESRAGAREGTATAGERALNEYARQSERTEQAARGALREAERVREREHRLDDEVRGR